MVEYQLIRSKRKTISIEVTADAEVIVRAPLRAPKKLITGFVQQKEGWILNCTQTARQKREKRESFAIQDGTKLLLLGREYPAALQQGASPAFDGERILLPQGEPENVRRAAVQIYRSFAKQHLPGRVEEFSRRTGLRASSVKISGAAKRWGSCSGSNSINFSWRLILAPPEAVDYVVVHELAHTLHHNHSTAFWRLVEKILPDYRSREEQLRALQHRLETENWREKE